MPSKMGDESQYKKISDVKSLPIKKITLWGSCFLDRYRRGFIRLPTKSDFTDTEGTGKKKSAYDYL